MEKEKAEKQTWFSRTIHILKTTFSGFMDKKCLKMSASLSYYTIFSLAPMLVLAIALAGLFLGRDAAEGKVFHEINGLVGNTAAAQIQEMIKNVGFSDKKEFALVIGIITLLLGATTVFGDMQDSINRIWEVRAKPKRGWVKLIKDRLLSSSLVISLGFLLIVSLILNGILVALMDYLKNYFSDATVYLFNLLNLTVSFLIIAVLFGVIFKVLPDVKIKWRDVRSGALFTAALFMVGRLIIGFYIQSSGTESAYGAAGAIIVILLWVNYTAAILYLGATFTRVYAESRGSHIAPAEFAVHVEEKETELHVQEIPPVDKNNGSS